MSTTPNWNTISRRTILLVVIAVAAAVIVNQLSPVGIPLMGQWDLAKGVIHANPDSAHLNDRLEIDNIEVAKLIYDGAKTLFVDARSVADYEAGHVKGAVSLSLNDFDAYIEGFINRYPPEQPIVTYCSGRTCEDSHRLEQLLFDNGYVNVSVFIDGYPGWKAEGYPIE